jgi:phosphoribosylformimino-5-aminoimidazole carboxamide ribotide isomerase
VVGIDARDGTVATHGWQQTSALAAIELGHRMHALGVRRVVYTDIGRDGMLTGVNAEATAQLGDVTGLKVIASGGVAGIGDIELLKAHEYFNIDGVIVGQALYAGALDLLAAIQTARKPLCWRSAGTVPYHSSPTGPQFLLIWNMCREQWQFPRTLLAEGECEVAAAQRSLEQETGLPLNALYADTRIALNYATTIREYTVERHSVYFLAQTATDEVCLSNEDHCEARWASAQEAWELLTETSPELLPALEAATAYLNAHPNGRGAPRGYPDEAESA